VEQEADHETQESPDRSWTRGVLGRLRSSRGSVTTRTGSDSQTPFPSTQYSTSPSSPDIERKIAKRKWESATKKLREEMERRREWPTFSTLDNGEGGSNTWSVTRGWGERTRNGSMPILYQRINSNYWTPITNDIHELLNRAGYVAEVRNGEDYQTQRYDFDYQEDSQLDWHRQ
jgi:hypothetical protein